MSGDAQDEPAIIRQAQAGSETAFAWLVQRYAKRVHDVARRMLRDAQEAEDAAQHAFLNAWRALERFDPERPFRNWILRITTNLCRNRIAARKVRSHVLDPRGGDDPVPEPEGRDLAAMPAGTSPALEAAIAQLPEAYRLAVVLRYGHGLAVAEVAEVLDLPVATAKTHLHRARAALRAVLAPETDAPPRGTKEQSP